MLILFKNSIVIMHSSNIHKSKKKKTIDEIAWIFAKYITYNDDNDVIIVTDAVRKCAVARDNPLHDQVRSAGGRVFGELHICYQEDAKLHSWRRRNIPDGTSTLTVGFKIIGFRVISS